MFEVEIKRNFSSAHSLSGYDGNCSAVHGHNWTVHAILECRELDKIGIAYDFRTLKNELDEIILDFDHKNLNDLEIFEFNNPTSESIAKLIYERLSAKLNKPGIKVSRVRVSESDESGAAYFE